MRYCLRQKYQNSEAVGHKEAQKEFCPMTHAS
jgi:hypothetical protein